MLSQRIDQPFRDLTLDKLEKGTNRAVVMSDGDILFTKQCIILINVKVENECQVMPVVSPYLTYVPIKTRDIVGHMQQVRNDSVEADDVDYSRSIVLGMINTSENTPEDIVSKLVELFNKYRECFAMNLSELGCTDVIEIVIVNDWKKQSISSDTKSPYASTCILANKKYGDHRLVVDL